MTTSQLGDDLYHNYGLRFYSADGRYLAGLVENTESKVVQLELNDNVSASSASLTVGNGLADLVLTGDEQTNEAWSRTKSEYSKQLNAAKTPQERQRVMSNYPSHGVRARINAFPKGTSSVELTYGSSLSTRNAIEMYLSKDGQPTLHLVDEKGISRAVLGYTKLERTATGIVEQLPPSSLVLFDKKGGVIWRAP